MPFLQVDSTQAIAQLEAIYSDLSGDKLRRAVAQGINKTMKKARTESARAIRQTFNIRHSTLLSKVFEIKSAYYGRLYAELLVKTNPIHMEEFMVGRLHAGGKINTATPAIAKRKASYKSKQGTIGGIKVKVLKTGPIKLFVNAFISSKTGNMVARSVQDGNKFSCNLGPNKAFHGRNKRLAGSGKKDSPIGAIMSVSPFGAAVNKVVQEKVYMQAARNLDDNIIKQIHAMQLGYIKDYSGSRRNKYGRFS